MAPWEPLPVETNEDAVTDRILDGLAARLPGWVPVEGAPEVALAEEVGRETAATNALAVAASDLAVAGVGETVFGLQSLLGAQATMPVRLTVTGAGAVVPAGFTVVGVSDDGVEVAFELVEEVTSSGTTVDATMYARDVGATANGVPIGPLTVVTATSTVTAADATGASAGGVDPEGLTAYLSRLGDYIATLRPGGVRAKDLATLARNVTGVRRALGIDLLDPGRTVTDGVTTASSTTVTSATAAFTGTDVGRTISGGSIPAGATISTVVSATEITISAAATASATGVTLTLGDLTDVERTATVVPIDADGLPVSAAVKDAVAAELAEVREVNFVIRVDEPTYTPVHVDFTAVAETGADPATVQANVHAAISSHISPATWGATTEDPTSWTSVDVVRYLDLARVAGSAEGIAYLDTLTLNGGTADLTLAGPAPLPAPQSGSDPSTVTGTVS
jgi:hypothetical protein